VIFADFQLVGNFILMIFIINSVQW